MATRDEWSRELLPASFAAIPLNVVRTSDNHQRALVRHGYPSREGAKLQDMGGEPRTTRMELVFFGENHIQHLRQMIAAWREGVVDTLIHPITGTFEAALEEFDWNAEAASRDFITATATFVEDILTADNQVIRSFSGEIPNRNLVDQDVEAVEAELVELGLESEVPEEVTEQLDLWQDAEPADMTRPQIELELSALSNRIQDEIDRLDLAADVANYPAYEAFVRLHNNLRNLAELLIAQAPRLTTYTVPVAAPLLVIFQGLYGGQGALDRYTRGLDMNRVLNPALVPAGTVLTVEVA